MTIHRKNRIILILCLLSGLLCAVLGRAHPADLDAEPRCGRSPDQGVLRPADSRWLSGDGAFSVSLTEDKRLWLFGDSLLDINGAGLTMVSNTVAIQQGGCRSALEVFWKGTSDFPRPFFKPDSGSGWLWPAGGIMARGVLYLFYYRVRRISPGGRWDFAVQDSVVMRITNPRKKPPEWPTPERLKSRTAPNMIVGLSPFFRGRYQLSFTSRKGQQGREVLLARTKKADLVDTHSMDWQFYTGDVADNWSADPRRARGLFSGVGTEFSIARLPGNRGWSAVYTPRGIGTKVVIRQAAQPEGPWGIPRSIFKCREPEADPNLFCYGAKLHPSCSRDLDDLWITYSVQARGEGALPAHLGRPHWARLPWP